LSIAATYRCESPQRIADPTDGTSRSRAPKQLAVHATLDENRSHGSIAKEMPMSHMTFMPLPLMRRRSPERADTTALATMPQ